MDTITICYYRQNFWTEKLEALIKNLDLEKNNSAKVYHKQVTTNFATHLLSKKYIILLTAVEINPEFCYTKII